MQGYESYKPSGIPWVGDIPSHWGIKKNKFLFSERKAVVGKDAPKFKLLSLTLQGVILRDMENPKGKFPAEFDTYKQVSPDDLVFCLFDVEETPRTVGLAKHYGMITGAYTVTRCNENVSSAFLYYYYLSLDQGKRLRSLYTGLRNVITRDIFFSLATPFPPREEQDRIVAFLDQKVGEIDTAIAKKERLIELLKEEKSVLIKTAVFGMNSAECNHVSAIPWVEKLPRHWGAKRAKYLFRQSRLPVKPSHEVVTAYRDGEVTLRSNRRLDGYTFAVLEQGYQGVRPGQLVINSMDAFAGAIGVSDSEGKCSPEYVVCDAINDSEISPCFAALVLRQMALSGYIEVICSAVRQRALRIRFNDFAPLLLPVPPINQQHAIVKLVEEIQAHHEVLVQQLRREIESLKEFQRGVVARVVTGQIRV
ncbi:restriction endonuclease subunit S [Aromatoleum evansii]|uniref:Restriction endonuclease subunit S n=1 Tax=Aromatoleum evansii TaxID=59406 RepID=A0ABZ1AP93_AROEV|nr:restriction endonuclease subunit S [Aromatoleum evansii]